jgi:hypothetical protein
MNITKTIEQYNENFVYFCEPIKNNIMNNGNFIRIIYSSPLFILNGIYLSIPITCFTIEKYYNKYKCIFDRNLYKDIIDKLRYIEVSILNKIAIKEKKPQYKIYEQMINGYFKIFNENTEYGEKQIKPFLLKISGVWETENEYGVTYKFCKL